MKKEFVYIDDAYWIIVCNRYMNVNGEEFSGFAWTIRNTKKEAITAFIAGVKDTPFYKGITWAKARQKGYHAKYVHVSVVIIK